MILYVGRLNICFVLIIIGISTYLFFYFIFEKNIPSKLRYKFLFISFILGPFMIFFVILLHIYLTYFEQSPKLEEESLEEPLIIV